MAIAAVLQTLVVLLTTWTLYGAVRRLFFHPLAHIPGPKLAALTWWYEFYYDVVQPGRYVFKIQELHKQYGPIIRITPDELHVCDVGFLNSVYAPVSQPRDKYEYQLRTLRVPGGVGTTARADVHKKRREALAPFFSKRNVTHLEPLFAGKVKQLREKIAKHAEEKTPANLSDLFFAFSNDIVTNFLFAHQTDVLADEASAATLRENSCQLLQGINVNKHFPWLPDFLESLPLSISKPMMPPGLIDMLSLFDRVRAELKTMIAAKASGRISDKPVGPTGKESVYDSVLDSPALPPAEKALLRLEQEGSLLVLAGTESPARALALFFYYVLSDASVLQKLRAELADVPADASWSQLEKLPYLGAVLEETNRLSWGVTARTARIAAQPLTYVPSAHVAHLERVGKGKSYIIPAGTPVSLTSLAVHTADVFPQPFTFDPDRWLGEKGRALRPFQFAFSQGSRKCLGMELASAQMYLATAALLKDFDMSLFETTDRDVEFKHDYQVAMPSLDSKGIRVMARARKQ